MAAVVGRARVRLPAGYQIPTPETRLFDTDDLIQAGYLAVVDAVAGYDPTAGMVFTSYLVYHLRRRFAEVSGRRGAKQQPEVSALSMETTINADGDLTIGDTLADPAAHWAYDDMIERESTRRDCAALLAELDNLGEDLQQAVKLHYCQGMTLQAAGTALGIGTKAARQRCSKAIRRLRHTSTARRLWHDNETRHVSLSRFQTTHTSEQEAYMLRWEEWDERIQELRAERDGPTNPET